ncbi:hypothetical protein BCR43DRAFT_369822 [Syncephalastrum racemosum]|uniref:Uncharacterized protein n=1 Tax=Syncephalastrum racemosum TaxID=13706 RepID=A0A1X2H477_SYNRA|nr:hypothetical protein BCR43DRAFT_369822 [Syncephalastrum racemosum]
MHPTSRHALWIGYTWAPELQLQMSPTNVNEGSQPAIRAGHRKRQMDSIHSLSTIYYDCFQFSLAQERGDSLKRPSCKATSLYYNIMEYAVKKGYRGICKRERWRHDALCSGTIENCVPPTAAFLFYTNLCLPTYAEKHGRATNQPMLQPPTGSKCGMILLSHLSL